MVFREQIYEGHALGPVSSSRIMPFVGYRERQVEIPGESGGRGGGAFQTNSDGGKAFWGILFVHASYKGSGFSAVRAGFGEEHQHYRLAGVSGQVYFPSLERAASEREAIEETEEALVG